MRGTDDPERWITNEVEPWILAAAHAGDIRAMRFAARRVRYRPSDVYERLSKRARLAVDKVGFGLPSPVAVTVSAEQATSRERAFWYTTAAERGDPESVAELIDQTVLADQREHQRRLSATIRDRRAAEDAMHELTQRDLRGELTPEQETRLNQLAAGPSNWIAVLDEELPLSRRIYGPHKLWPDHQTEHLRRLLAAARNHLAAPDALQREGLPDRWSIELCQAGARDGCAPCTRRWADHQRNHDLQRPWQEQAEHEPQGPLPDAGQSVDERAIHALIWGDADSVAEVIDQMPPHEHQVQHLLRLLTAARHHPDALHAGPGRWLSGWWSIELCQAGARDGCAPCTWRWADHQRNHGPRHQAELHAWQEQVEQELASTLPPAPPPRFGGGPHTVETVVITAVVTTGIVPFVKAMITKAAEDSYTGLRRHLLARFRKTVGPQEQPDQDDQLLVVRPPEGQQPSAVLQVWTDLPDEAITTLSQLLYDLRTTQPPHGAECRWYWNGAARRWETLQLHQAEPDQPGPDGGPDQE